MFNLINVEYCLIEWLFGLVIVVWITLSCLNVILIVLIRLFCFSNQLIYDDIIVFNDPLAARI